MKRAIEIVKRRKWLIIGPLVIVFFIPAVFSFLFMRSYSANSLVWLDSDVSISSVLAADATPVQGGSRPIEGEASTLQQLLQSRAFVEKVIESTPLKSKLATAKGAEKAVLYVRKNVRTDVVGPNALKITFYAKSPKEAVTIADTMTNEFIAWLRSAIKTQNSKSIGFFQQRSDEYATELQKARADLQKYMERHPETRQLAIADKVLSQPNITASPAVQSEFKRLQSQVDYAQKVYDGSLTDLAKTRVVTAAQEEKYVNGMRIVDKPVEPTSYSKKRLFLFDFMALMAAVIVAGLAVVVAEITDRTLHSETDVEEALDLLVLAEVSHPESQRRGA